MQQNFVEEFLSFRGTCEQRLLKSGLHRVLKGFRALLAKPPKALKFKNRPTFFRDSLGDIA
jgi:hypothetical protein